MEILEAQRLAEYRANQTDFSSAEDGEFEVGAAPTAGDDDVQTARADVSVDGDATAAS